MKKIIGILLIWLIALLYVSAQNYVGLHKEEIKKVMKAKQKNFKLNTDAESINPPANDHPARVHFSGN